MNTYTLATIFGILAIPVLALMWWGWRARARRDANIVAPAVALTGAVIERFSRSSYVSTTTAGAPLVRLAIPGLRYKGFADVAVRADGVTIEVTGESAVHVPVALVQGTDTAGRRIGKAVERDGLSLLLWHAHAPQPGTAPDADLLESSFRFSGADEQQRFDAAIATMLMPDRTSRHTAAPQAYTPQHTTQEDA